MRYAYFLRLLTVVSEKVAMFATTCPIVVQLLPLLLVIKRWIVNPDSLLELSVQERFILVEVANTATRFEGAAGATGLGVGIAVGDGVAVRVGEGVGVAVGIGVDVAVGVGLAVGVGVIPLVVALATLLY